MSTANVNGGLIKKNEGNNTAPIVTVKGLICNVDYKKRFEEILGKKAQAFMSSVINVAKTPSLADCEPTSVVSAAVVAATLDLPIDPNLGFSYIVPYYNNKKKIKEGQFQIGYKGFIQLAQRSGQFKTINAVEIREGELKKVNRLTGEIELNEEFDLSTLDEKKVVGYVGYFSLLNGFEKAFYMSREQLEAHGKKYSQSYKSEKKWISDASLWTTDFDSMATKTVLKLLLSKYAPLSIEMQTAVAADQAVIKKDVINSNAEIDGSSMEYVDNTENENIIDAEYTENSKEFEGTPLQD